MKNFLKFRAPFAIQPGEGPLVVRLLLLYIFLGLSFALTSTAAYALFIEEFGANSLPYTFIGIAVGVSLIGFGYLWLNARLSLPRMLLTNLAFLLVMTLAIWIVLGISHARWLIFLLPVWELATINLGNIVVWSLVGQLLNVRQSKRLVGLIGSGRWLAAIVGGFLVPVLLTQVGTTHLLLISSAGLLAALVMYISLLKRYHSDIQTPAHSPRQRKTEPASQNVFRNPSVRLIFALMFVWVSLYFFTRQIFFSEAVLHYGESEALASLVSIVGAIYGLITLVLSLFFVAPVIERYGLRVAVFLNPIIMLVIYGAMAIFGAAQGETKLIFYLATLGHVANIAVSLSFDSASFRLLYQPLETKLRLQASAAGETIVEPIYTGLVGGVLLIMTAWLALPGHTLAFAALAVALMWTGIAILIVRGYPGMLKQALKRRRLGETPVDVAAELNQVVIEQGIRSPNADVVIYSVNLLGEANPTLLNSMLGDLLHHSSMEVQRDALQRIERARLAQALPAVRELIATRPAPQVHEAALRTLISVGGVKVLEEFPGALDTGEGHVRRGLVLGLLNSGSSEAVGQATEKITQWSTSTEVAERALAAELLGEVEGQSLFQTLLALLDDPELSVQRAALKTAGRVAHPQLWSVVLASLNHVQLRRAARSALIAGGDAVLPNVDEALAAPRLPSRRVIHLAHVCGRIGTEKAAGVLEKHLGYRDPTVRSVIVRSLHLCAYKAKEGMLPKVEAQMKEEVAFATSLLVALADIGDGAEDTLIHDALTDEFRRSRERILHFLTFQYDIGPLPMLQDAFAGHESGRRAFALEMIEMALPQPIRATIMPVLEIESAADAKRLNALTTLFPQQALGREDRLHTIINSTDIAQSEWVRLCARYSFDEYRQEGFPMLSLLERVLILKTVDLFAGTPSDVLAEVALLLEEVSVSAGEPVFQKGDHGDSMYIVVSGLLHVHDGDRVLNRLNERSVFGEMALLDPEPRMAWVTAIEESVLFRLDQAPFFELLADRAEVARGVIRVLTARLRAQVRDVMELHGKVQELEQGTQGVV